MLPLPSVELAASVVKRPLWSITCNISRSPCRLPQHQHYRIFSTKQEGGQPTATAGSDTTTTSVPSRTVFPWRHQLHPPPRLIPGTIEEKEAPPIGLTPIGKKWVSYVFLQGPFWDVWIGRRFEKELANSAAYAFGQAVAGIVANVYRIPFATTQQSDEGSIQFTYDPSKDIQSEDKRGDAMKDENVVATGTKHRKRRIRRRLIRRACAPKRPIPTSRWMYATNRLSNGVIFRRAPRQLVLKQMRKHEVVKRKRKSRQRLGGCRRAKSRTRSSSRQESTSRNNDSDESRGPLGKYCSNISEMVSPELLDLYKSARAHGKDQIVHLNMEPLGGQLICMTAFPFCSRRMAKEDPSTFRSWRELYPGTMNAKSLRNIERLVSETLARNGHLELTVEIQVVVPCRELFYVADCGGGATPQTKLQQVMHVVRLEATTEFGYNKKDGESDDNSLYVDTSDWIVTDIDDLVGHKTWYHL